jgi:tyrosyl-tRNA synthetase
MKAGRVNPRDVKVRLAHEIVENYHKHEGARAAELFDRAHSGARQQSREDYEALAEDLPLPADLNGTSTWISTALAQLGLTKSKGEATRLVKGGGVYLNEVRLTDPQAEVTLAPGMLLRVGKRKIVKLTG